MNKFKKIFKEFLFAILMAFFLSFIVRAFLMEPRIVPTCSMLPTIQCNQRILINKLAYLFTLPERGEVIVFKPPIETEEKADYIKRVIGVSGDTVEIKNGMIIINDKAIEEKYLCDKPNYSFGPVTVPDNSLFVLGDNRNISFDSHIWDKWLKIKDVKGRAFCVYWPIKYIGFLK